MIRWVLSAVLLTMFTSSPLWAGGFGFYRPISVSSYYYCAPPVAYYPISPAPVIYSVPAVTVQPIQRVQPVIAAPVPCAVPTAAPPSTSSEPPMSKPAVGTSTSMRVGESSYEVLAGPEGMSKVGGRCSVAFWNLTGRTVSLRIDGRDVTLAAGKTTTLDLPMTFAWQIDGREGQATRIPEGKPTAEILIRR
jgi:hypothetical protein